MTILEDLYEQCPVCWCEIPKSEMPTHVQRWHPEEPWEGGEDAG